jgi:hypothetical protein
MLSLHPTHVCVRMCVCSPQVRSSLHERPSRIDEAIALPLSPEHSHPHLNGPTHCSSSSSASSPHTASPLSVDSRHDAQALLARHFSGAQ